MDFLGIGIGLPQILLILIVALLVFGPERLPEIARQIARGINQLRSYASDMQGQFGAELEEIRSEVLSIQRDLSSVQANLRQGLGEIDESLRSVTSEVHESVATPLRALPPSPSSTSSTPGAAPDETQRPASAALPDYAPPTPPSARPYLRPVPPPEPEAPSFDGRLPDYRPRS